MKYVLINYNYDPSWVKEYTNDYLIYDRSDDGIDWIKDIPKENIIKTENRGDVDYDKLSYIVDNYYDLPDVFLLSKSNLWKFITKEEFDKVKDNQSYTPLLTKDHVTYEPICRYNGEGMYEELNNSWYLNTVPSKYFPNYLAFAVYFRLRSPQYLAFAPGGSYIVTSDRIRRYGRDFYDQMRQILPYCQRPGEAHMIERTYHTLWR